jgi:hypothetical protein
MVTVFALLAALLVATPASAGPGDVGDDAAATDAAEKSPFSKKPRRAQPRSDLSDDLLALLPWRGIYAAGRGVTAPAWRVVVTAEGDLRAGSNPKPGSSPIALVDRKRRKVTPPVLAELIKLADRAWREKRTAVVADPENAEVLIIVDGADVFQLDAGGPLTTGAAGQLMARLKAEAAH